MKALIRRLGRVRHAVATVILQGVIGAGAGLFQANTALLVGGIIAILLSVTVLVATYLVDPVLEGVIVELQQPQLPDVQTHTHCTKELAQAS
jgi:hypothetical protein